MDSSNPPLINFGNPEPLRSSRWSPKPDQIMILESIFSGGMVNPSKDQTKRIRKMLENYGPVGDTNVFYWFQNRRSRCRRRQRKNMESERGGGGGAQPRAEVPATQLDNNLSVGFELDPVSCGVNTGSSSSSSYAVDGSDYTYNNNNSINTYDDFFRCLGPPAELVQEYNQHHNHEMNYHPEIITVFINGVATDVKRERLHVTNIFVGDFVMYDSSGIPLQVDHKGFLVQCLEHGENYYLVATLSS